ncbi:MAG: AAA family ATPase [Candidatus Woesebacteria bacterium]|jgi:dephospho-CoA kinase
MIKIIGLVGTLASGKTSAANYFKKKGFHIYKLSDVIRDELRQRKMPITRKNLQDIGNELRENFGGDVLVKRVIAKAKTNGENMVFDGIRNPQEIKYIKKKYQVPILGITALEQTRMKRFIARTKDRRDEDGKTSEEFQIANDRDLGKGENNNGQQVSRCLKLCDYLILNEKKIADLYRSCDCFLEEYNLD